MHYRMDVKIRGFPQVVVHRFPPDIDDSEGDTWSSYREEEACKASPTFKRTVISTWMEPGNCYKTGSPLIWAQMREKSIDICGMFQSSAGKFPGHIPSSSSFRLFTASVDGIFRISQYISG